MSEFHIEEANLELKIINDPDNCESILNVEIMQGIVEIAICIRGCTSDTREFSSNAIFLERKQIEELYNFIGDHLKNVSKS